MDGAHAYTTSSFAPDSGRSLEFVATYRAANYQNVGFAADGDFTAPWVAIGMGPNQTGVFARTSGGAEILLSSSTLGSPHRYRIDWSGSSFVFYVDGARDTSISFPVSGNMVALASDFDVAGNALSVDWLRVARYPSSGSFLSRVFDGLGPTNWGVTTWTSSTPAGTSLSVFARTGSTPTPNGSWTPYDLLPNGGSVSANSRYIQYRADLATSLSTLGYTPVLQDLAIACTAGPDLAPPVLSNIAAVPAPDGQRATITWTTDERSTSRVDYGVNAALLSLNASNSGLVRSHSVALTGLSPGATYYFRVTSADGSSNAATSPNPPAAPLTFTAPSPACFVDQTESQFGQGTPTGAYVSVTTDGEVLLAPAWGSEFSGGSLGSEWTSAAWGTGGTSTVLDGSVAVDGARLTSTNTTGYTTGRVLEFVATFGAAAYQNAGFGAGDNSLGTSGMFATGDQPWAMFGTAGSTTTLYSRLNPGGDVSLGTSYIGSRHLFRIEWRADSLIFLIDGASLDRRAANLSTAMRPGISDYAVGSPALSVDWLRMTPYAASGTFLSRVYDAGAPTQWGTMSWTAMTPTNASLAMAYRTGNIAVPDSSWSTFTTVASSGGAVGVRSRYIQYQAQLATSDSINVTATLQDVSISCCTDVTPPVVMSDVAAQPLAVDSNADGTLQVRVTFTAPADAAAVEVYRAAFGNYPEYDDAPGAGSLPSTPSYPPEPARWTLTGVTASGQTDEAAQRDQYYYAAFARDHCGNVSAASNVTPGVLNYVLGDMANGLAACVGDDKVNLADVSFLGAHYGGVLGAADPLGCLDVGPTTSGSVTARPTTDNVLNFEDLMVVAINFMLGSRPPTLASRAEAATGDVLTLGAPGTVQAGDLVTARLLFAGTGVVQGISTQLSWDAAVVEPVGVEAGTMLNQQGGVALSSRPGNVDAAVLGASRAGLVGTGELAEVTFRALSSGDPRIEIASARARDGANRPVSLGQQPAGGERPRAVLATELGPAYPNPFSAGLGVQLSLAHDGHAKLMVFDMAGRRVKRLLEGEQPAGVQLVRWDGRDEGGRLLPAGFYVLRLEVGNTVRARRVQLIR